MRGFIEIKEDSYENTIEYLHKIKLLACKLMKMLTEQVESDEDDEYEDEEEHETKSRKGHTSRGRYSY